MDAKFQSPVKLVSRRTLSLQLYGKGDFFFPLDAVQSFRLSNFHPWEKNASKRGKISNQFL